MTVQPEVPQGTVSEIQLPAFEPHCMRPGCTEGDGGLPWTGTRTLDKDAASAELESHMRAHAEADRREEALLRVKDAVLRVPGLPLLEAERQQYALAVATVVMGILWDHGSPDEADDLAILAAAYPASPDLGQSSWQVV